MKKRILSMILAVSMILSMVPMVGFAAGETLTANPSATVLLPGEELSITFDSSATGEPCRGLQFKATFPEVFNNLKRSGMKTSALYAALEKHDSEQSITLSATVAGQSITYLGYWDTAYQLTENDGKTLVTFSAEVAEDAAPGTYTIAVTDASWSNQNAKDFKYSTSDIVVVIPVTAASIDLTAPEKGEELDVDAAESDYYTDKVEWFAGAEADGTAVTGKAAPNTQYTVKVTLTPNEGQMFADEVSVAVGESTVTLSPDESGNLVYTQTFDTTEMAVVDSVAVTKEPAKTTYVEGEEFDPTGMVITATFDGGDIVSEVTDYTTYPAGPLTPDVTEITISYTDGTGKTVTATVTVTVLNKLEVSDFTVVLPQNAVYNGLDHTAQVTVLPEGVNAEEVELVYTVGEDVVTGTKNAATYNVTLKFAGNETCAAAELDMGSFTVAPAEVTITASDMTMVMNTEKTLTVSYAGVEGGTQPNGTISYSTESALITVDAASGKIAAGNVMGQAVVTITYTPGEGDNYAVTTKDVTITVQDKFPMDKYITFIAKETEVTYKTEGYKLSDLVNEADYSGTTSGEGAIVYTVNDKVVTLDEVLSDAATYVVKATYQDDEYRAVASLTVKIVPQSIDMSTWVWTGDLDTDYNGEQKSVLLNLDAATLAMVDISYTGNTATNAGSYTATASVSLKADYANNYTLTGVATTTWKINRAAVAIPTATNFTYDGTEKTGVAEVEGKYTVANGKATVAGDYTAVATLNDNYKWEDDTTAAKSIEWSIAKAEVTAPSAAEGLKYDGTEKIGVASADAALYTVTGGSATDAGDYTATATLVDADNYQWADTDLSTAREITWSIAKADKQNAVINDSVRYDAQSKTIAADSLLADAKNVVITDVSVSGDNAGLVTVDYSTGDLVITLVDVTVDDAEKVVVITATFNSNNYADGSTAQINLTIKDKEDVAVTLEAGEVVYTGEAQQPTATVGDENFVAADNAELNYVFKQNGQVVTQMVDAGTYTVQAFYEDDVYSGESEEVSFVIKPAQLTITGGTAEEKTYDGTNEATVTAVTFAFNGETVALTGDDYTVTAATFAGVNAGTTLVNFTVELKETVNTNNFTLGTATAGTAHSMINQKEIKVELADIAAVTYNGEEQVAAVTVTAEGLVGEDSLTKDVDYTVSNGVQKNAGTYAVAIVPVATSNYTFSNDSVLTKDFVINQAAPKASVADLEAPYNPAGLADSQIPGTADVDGSWSWKTQPEMAVGEQSGVVTFTPADSVNYVSVDLPINVTIVRATPSGQPEMDEITGAGKTLADANIREGTLVPAGGTFAWYDAEGNELPLDTEVEAGEAYYWVYTPTEADLVNYTTLTGSVVFYTFIPPVVNNYVITILTEGEGTVVANTVFAAPGSNVILTVDGQVASVIAVDSYGNQIMVSQLSAAEYAFVMPAATVTVKVTFGEGSGSGSVIGWINPFIDVAEGDWFYESVKYVHMNGLMNGVEVNLFAPNTKLTRAMLMTILARLDGVNTEGGATWYEIGMNWAVAEGISDGTNPMANITREQVATMLYRFAGCPVVFGDSTASYPDADEISDWAEDAMNWAVAAGLMKGDENGNLNPTGDATRAEVATLLMRFVENVLK